VTSPAAKAPSLVEALAVWALLGLSALAVLVTYSRIPPEQLWNVRADGLAGGLGRTLVLVNFPIGLAAIALSAVAAARLDTRPAAIAGAAACVLCLAVAVPGTVEADDLAPKLSNAVPALGVALALALTGAAAWRRGVGRPPARVRFDGARVAIAAVLLVLAIPWAGAELGFHVTLGGVFEADRIVPEPGHPNLAAVHLGHHHGTDGVLLTLTALLLTRELGRIHRPRLRLALTAYLSLMLVYGLANTVDDFWLEQVVKRDWSGFVFPGMLRPALSPAWLAILAAAVGVYALLRRAAAAERHQ
jgi:uncharacterized membrane protein